MANLIAPVKDGKIEQTDSQASIANSKNKKNENSKDTFLQLLVAEVQNQDPLQPTSNTEWVSQYATFSELEIMQGVGASFDLSRASGLVGKTVIINTTTESGKVSTIQGKVDYVTYESGKAYLSVNGSSYSIDDLTNIVDTEYVTAFDKVYAWSVELNKLPAIENVTYADIEKVDKIYDEYAKMSDYEKTFVAQENKDKIEKLHELTEVLKKAQEADKEQDNKTQDSKKEDADTGNSEAQGSTET